jgi:DNA-binding transcriptional regulator YdaS (Cro superfamily)
MADLYAVVQRHMKQRDMSLRALARAVHHDPSYISKALRGLKPLGPALARDIDRALEAGGEITAAALRPAPVPPETPVAPELVDYFRQQLAGHYAADRFLGPGRLIAVAAAQYDLLCDIAGTATPPLRGKLWATAAGFAALLGWLHQDAGDLAESARWHDVMIERAHRSHDPQLVGFRPVLQGHAAHRHV